MPSAVSRWVLLLITTVCFDASLHHLAGLQVDRDIYHFRVLAGDPEWDTVLSSAGFLRARDPELQGPMLLVLRGDSRELSPEVLRNRVGQGWIVILEGLGSLAEAFGFRDTGKRVTIRSVRDLHDPKLDILWERAAELPLASLPTEAQLFSWERWTHAPLVAGYRLGQGGVLWTLCGPGRGGFERFPYLLQALAGLGLQPPFRSRALWAFFDPSYRLRVDLEYFARRWRQIGIAALHVAAWQFWEPDPQRDVFLERLIRECHRAGILVYAWLEFPHVSERFWERFPQWREKTALLQDAHLDWRKLMNLADRDCFETVARDLERLMERFDWDGVNLAELYFESLEGYSSPARFTPMNDGVRKEFRERHGFDPLELFQPEQPRYHARSPESLRLFLEFRVELALRLQRAWMERLVRLRDRWPHLGLALTHVDDRFDNTMRDKIGADAAATLAQAEAMGFTFIVEDPATIWHLGPERYRKLASAYRSLVQRPDRLAVDINIVERYQDVYPTKQQTGTELLSLLHLAAQAFPRVAVYAEHSIRRPDVRWIPSALAVVRRVERGSTGVAVELERPAGVRWKGPVRVDGREWPWEDGEVVWLPAGRYTLSHSSGPPPVRLLDFNGLLLTAAATADGIEFSYEAEARALAILDRKPSSVELDGSLTQLRIEGDEGRWVLFLPRGQHLVSVRVAVPAGGSRLAE